MLSFRVCNKTRRSLRASEGVVSEPTGQRKRRMESSRITRKMYNKENTSPGYDRELELPSNPGPAIEMVRKRKWEPPTSHHVPRPSSYLLPNAPARHSFPAQNPPTTSSAPQKLIFSSLAASRAWELGIQVLAAERSRFPLVEIGGVVVGFCCRVSCCLLYTSPSPRD